MRQRCLESAEQPRKSSRKNVLARHALLPCVTHCHSLDKDASEFQCGSAAFASEHDRVLAEVSSAATLSSTDRRPAPRIIANISLDKSGSTWYREATLANPD